MEQEIIRILVAGKNSNILGKPHIIICLKDDVVSKIIYKNR